jgi:RND family efflux transporter MFP subunit
VAALLTVAVGWLLAHEGHVALPARGAKVDAARGHLILTAESRDALDVGTVEIARQPLPRTLLASLNLESPWGRHAFASSRLAGKIVKLAVQPGQTVTAGQVLAEVASQELETFQGEVLNLANDEQLARKRVEGLERASDVVPDQNILDARTALQQAKNAMLLARAKWRALRLEEKTLDDLLASGGKERVATLPVRSPIAGTVIHADLNVGKVADPGEHLFEVVDLARVWARLGILERDSERVQAGQEVAVQLTAYPGETFRTRVAMRSPMLDAGTHLLSAWAELENASEPRFLPGMSGQARVLLPPREKTWTIPAAALIDDGVEQYVLVEEARTAAVSEYRKRPVVFLARVGDKVEVQSPDLLPGDRVVSRGAHELGSFFIPGVVRPGREAIANWGLVTAPVTAAGVEDVVEVEGHVEILPDRRAVASAQLSGNILRLGVERGVSVAAGDLVAEVVSQEFLTLQLDLLRESLALQLTEQQYQRQQQLTGVVPQRRLVELEAARIAGRNRVDSLRNRLRAVGLSPEQLTALVEKQQVVEALPVRAPIAGTVVDFPRVLGQVIRPDEPLVEIHDLSRAQVIGFVTERDVARVHVGQAGRVRLTSDPGTILPAKVVRSSRVFRESDQTLAIWVRAEPPPGLVLRHRQMARLTLTIATHPATLAVPLPAVVREGTRTFVFVRSEDGAFDRREVTLGRGDDRVAEVLSGLRRGEIIAVAGVAGLRTAHASVR